MHASARCIPLVVPFLFASCGSLGEFNSDEARRICQEAGVSEDFAVVMASSTINFATLVRSSLQGTADEGNALIIANSVGSYIVGSCGDAHIQSECRTGPCIIDSPDIEACCQICDMDQARSLLIACIECSNAIMQATLTEQEAAAAEQQTQQLLVEAEGIGDPCN